MNETTTETTITLDELADWLHDQTWSDFAQSLSRQYLDTHRLSPKQEAAARSMHAKVLAKAATRLPAAHRGEDPPKGLHVRPLDGAIIRVIATRNTGQIVGKELVAEDGDWHWLYRGKKGLRTLTADTLMSDEQARLWGWEYMQCINCFADLEDRRSLAAGYGPVCSKNNGWHYPTMAEAEAILAKRGKVS
jgi:hypothetical protein